jgi:hypothetical protein
MAASILWAAGLVVRAWAWHLDYGIGIGFWLWLVLTG